MTSLIHLGALLILGVGALTFVGCSDSGSAAGAEGQGCYANGTCDEGLECRSDLCVATSGSGGGATPGTGGGGTTTPGTGGGGTTTPGTGGGGTTTPGDVPCSLDGEFEGSCVSGDLQQCVDGAWASASCEGCELVSPTATCAWVTPVTLRSVGTDFVSEQPTDLKFEQASGMVAAEWYLDANEVGMLQFVFSSALDEEKVKVLGASGDVDMVTLETEDGESGCQYRIKNDGSLSRDAEYGVDDYGVRELYWNGCWGIWESNVTLGSGPVSATVLNIRSEQATSNELIDLSVTRILI